MQPKRHAWSELRKYLFATDTTQTTNSQLPWKNKTTIPKITQIRDNLMANLMITCFPKRRWVNWIADRKDDASREKREAILNYMTWVISQPMFKYEVQKCISDYIDYGNCFATVEWIDQRQESDDGSTKVGYVGPALRRISPLDIVFNPIAPTFEEAPKIVRSFMTLGELKKKLDSMSLDENNEEYRKLYDYLNDYRQEVRQYGSADIDIQDEYLRVDGFESFRAYLESDYVEILTFYGDLYDHENGELLSNHVAMIADKHKMISLKPNPSAFGYPPVFHCGWRIRQDNLWAMGPLENLVGMQYRIDHVENIKADVFDLIAFPAWKIRGQVQDFEYGPMQRIYVYDNESDVEMLAPPYQILQANSEIDRYENTMEMMAGSPKETMGFRTPGEKTAFEVQRLENAAGRIYQNKSVHLEEQFTERVLNAMLELARRNIKGVQEINVFDDDFKFQTFLELTANDIAGAGRLKPIGARHFAEKAETVQNIVNLYNSGIGQDQMVMSHISALGIAKMMEELLELGDFSLVQPNIRLSEQADMQRMQQIGEEQNMMSATTPSGLTEDDTDEAAALAEDAAAAELQG